VTRASESRSKIIKFTNVRSTRKTGSVLSSDHQKQIRRPRVIAITSGKGGVGKTNIVANLGFSLGKLGKKVLILDADLGLGNLDILLGLSPRYNLSHVLSGEKNIAEIIVNGPGTLKILPASSGIQELTLLSESQRFTLSKELEKLVNSFDILLIDTAAGISSNVLYFNLSAQEIMVVVTPEPTSITDAYALMKVLSMRYREKNFKLIINSVCNRNEADEVHRQLNLVTSRFLNLSVEYFGYVLTDKNIKKSVRKQKVICEWAPYTPASIDFAVLAEKIFQSEPPMIRRKKGFFGYCEIPMQNVD
jgi:flagellar biosynthesis protein FlhG